MKVIVNGAAEWYPVAHVRLPGRTGQLELAGDRHYNDREIELPPDVARRLVAICKAFDDVQAEVYDLWAKHEGI